jgi:metallo-beta-lactamase family protein
VRSSSPPTVTFFGATQTVTGSMHLVEVPDHKVLLDCGLYFGNRQEGKVRNKQFPFAADKIDSVIISHAHVDHCGNLPHLVRRGFSGPIYCTPATKELMTVMLTDSARIQEEEADSAPVAPPTGVYQTYTRTHVERTIKQCVGVDYGVLQDISDHISLRLVDAGHILGSAMVALRLNGTGREFSITYTGDLGRQDLPFLRPPAPIPLADLLICESTYGGRTHQPLESLAATLAEIIEKTVKQEGKVLIPAFSLGRAQIVVHYLEKWIHEGIIPNIPIYVDSPLVAKIVQVYRQFPNLLTENSQAVLHPEASSNGYHPVQYIQSWDESRELGQSKEPCVIVASGGMLDSGRALYHLQQVIDDPRCSIALVSYQAPHSLGWRLLQPGPTVYFLGKMWNKWANVYGLNGFSGHADHNDFMAAFKPLEGFTQSIHLVHGELEQAAALAEGLRQQGFDKVNIPQRDEVAEVIGH